jgi:hypothetical protein
MTDDKMAWLRAQLDADEKVAQTCLQSQADRLGVQLGTYHWQAREGGVWLDRYSIAARLSDEHAEHIARWDPARALADINADRRLIQEWRDAESRRLYYERDGEEPFAAEARGYAEAMAKAVRIRAVRFADRPGCPDEWLTDHPERNPR